MHIAGTIYSIGHSNLSFEQFAALLTRAGIEAVADVRSSPWSRHNPQFNRDTLKAGLKSIGIAYSHICELGGRPTGSGFYCEGIADYRKMAAAPAFGEGLQRLYAGMTDYRIAIMCAEQNPLECHRCLLVGRALHASGRTPVHLLHDGSSKTQADIESELLALAGKEADDLFAPIAERIEAAYWAQNRKNAFVEPQGG